MNLLLAFTRFKDKMPPQGAKIILVYEDKTSVFLEVAKAEYIILDDAGPMLSTELNLNGSKPEPMSYWALIADP